MARVALHVTVRSMRAVALCIEGLHKSYRAGVPGCMARARVLRGVDLRVRTGEIVVVLGAMGAGKSTLLRCAAGLLRPDAGSVTWPAGAGDHLHHVCERRAGVPGWSAAGRLLVVDSGADAVGDAGATDPAALADTLRRAARRGEAALVARPTHDAVCGAADRLLVLHDGRLREAGATRAGGGRACVDHPWQPP
jgi:ABC-type sugar transport system ATPase subunit